ncbi:uncharacterized protein LOC104884263 [Beta vulgaris subsp. vulgaris]|uniref:uncharacterized protein LOC104884263 n=1 Tax=Beta vulgaris subsp. vulgaris TaxID=3555 RepID=UPI0009010E6A|nr:uncharacterized protein LOC104884263 [Beta vulgaris subsp. vulgaris]
MWKCIGQLANAINSRNQGALPSKTKVNPKEQIKAITLRSGTTLSEANDKSKDNIELKENEQNNEELVEKELESPSLSPVKPYVPPIPFPQRPKKNKFDNQFEKFLKMFKELQINIPFVDALMQIPSYSKFLKEIMSKKRKLEDYETIALSEECSDVI